MTFVRIDHSFHAYDITTPAKSAGKRVRYIDLISMKDKLKLELFSKQEEKQVQEKQAK